MSAKCAGYMGSVILVDLTTETVTEYPWSDEQRELYLSGKIMAVRILCDHLTEKETAFSEENWVVISTGPLTGDQLPKRLTDVPQDPRDPRTKTPLETMKKTYYGAQGWDKNGIPTEAALRRLKIK